ncbi:hypothetical protein C8Q80DRAFT_1091069 [Daedaleopsis nitida]|nr:hypothetical protein C8Q80DRAFT_1091069 [Daedaleopsis nitida]
MRLPIDLLSLAFATAWFSANTPFAFATLVNVTIDDTLGDERTGAQIVYEPPDVWKVGQNCIDCTAKLDQSQLQNGTWHEGTLSAISESAGVANQPLTATAAFEGVAVFIYCAVAHTFTSPVGRSAMTFYIDNEQVGHFTQETTGDSNIQYNLLVYSNTTLSSGNHTIMIENGVLNDEQSLILLDYILYTYVSQSCLRLVTH